VVSCECATCGLRTVVVFLVDKMYLSVNKNFAICGDVVR
jgi:hypothetical protein